MTRIEEGYGGNAFERERNSPTEEILHKNLQTLEAIKKTAALESELIEGVLEREEQVIHHEVLNTEAINTLVDTIKRRIQRTHDKEGSFDTVGIVIDADDPKAVRYVTSHLYAPKGKQIITKPELEVEEIEGESRKKVTAIRSIFTQSTLEGLWLHEKETFAVNQGPKLSLGKKLDSTYSLIGKDLTPQK